MARFKIIHTGQDGRTFYGLSRTEDHYPLMYLQDGEADTVEVDYSDILATGETVSSIATETEGAITLSASAINAAGTKVTLTLTGAGSWARVKLTATLSSGAIKVDRIEIRNRLRYQARYVDDYWNINGYGDF